MVSKPVTALEQTSQWHHTNILSWSLWFMSRPGCWTPRSETQGRSQGQGYAHKAKAKKLILRPKTKGNVPATNSIQTRDGKIITITTSIHNFMQMKNANDLCCCYVEWIETCTVYTKRLKV